MNTNQYYFEKAPVSKAVAKMAIPTIITQLVFVIYNMVDTFFIGQTHDPVQVAAVSLTTPVFVILTGLGNLFGIGGSSVISRAMGEKKIDWAKKTSSFCCYASVITGLLMALILLIKIDDILVLMGASENTTYYAKQYLICIGAAAPIITFSATISNILRSEGASKEAMTGNMMGTVTNIILDPIMILAMGWGCAGAAIATVLGNVIASAYYFSYFARKKSVLSIAAKDFTLKDRIPKNVIAIGVPAALNTMLTAIAFIVQNNIIGKYGDIPLAALGITNKVVTLVTSMQIGLGMGVQPLIGYCYGANDKKRMIEVFRFTGICAVLLGTALTTLLGFSKGPIIGIFINDAEVISYGETMIVARMFSGPILGLLYLILNTLQGMGKVVPSLCLSICREGIFCIPLLLLLDKVFGINGAIYSQTVSDYLTIILAIIICAVVFHRMQRTESPLQKNL